MKLNKLLIENGDFNKNEITDWVLEHVYYHNKTNKNIAKNEFRIEADGSIHIFDSYLVKTDEKVLPYKFYPWVDGYFGIEAPHLETCKNFPIRATNDTSFTFGFNKCNNLDFSLLSNIMNSAYFTIIINNISNISISKIYNYVKFTHRLDCFNCVSMSDCSLWNDINTRVFNICFGAPIKNFTNILNIPLGRLEFFRIVSTDTLNQIHNPIYSEADAILLQQMALKYRKKFDDPQKYSMDMTLELIEAGFEDIA